MNLSIFTVFLKNRNFTSKNKKSKVTDYAALRYETAHVFRYCRAVEHRRFRRACANAQTRQNLLCSHTQNIDVDKDSELKAIDLSVRIIIR